jgi:hypothetical protein
MSVVQKVREGREIYRSSSGLSNKGSKSQTLYHDLFQHDE